MNENWPEIVQSLLPYFKKNSNEYNYQQEIERCFRYLGWKQTNGTMVSQVALPIGNNNTIKPDIVLEKKDENDKLIPVLPIEIKRPSNVKKGRQEQQLFSYMRQLKLNIGLYIGENIELYYDFPLDIEDPICVFIAEIDENDNNGSVFCDLLTYNDFESNAIEDFCKEQYQKIIARNNLQSRLAEFFSSDNAVKNVMAVLKEKFINEGYAKEAIEDEFSTLNIQVGYKCEIKNSQQKNKQKNKQVKPESKKAKLSAGYKKIKITYPNGEIIQEEKCVDTLRLFIEKTGISKAASVGLIECGVPLIASSLDEKYGARQKPLSNGQYLMTNTDTLTKIKDIEKISESLNLKVKVELV